MEKLQFDCRDNTKKQYVRMSWIEQLVHTVLLSQMQNSIYM